VHAEAKTTMHCSTQMMTMTAMTTKAATTEATPKSGPRQTKTVSVVLPSRESLSHHLDFSSCCIHAVATIVTMVTIRTSSCRSESRPQKKDAYATTSAESLTICQLLSGVDMAGAILSPDVLKNIIGLYCSSPREDEDNENDCIVVEDELGLEMPIQNDDHEIDEDDSNNNLQQQEQREKQKLTKEFVHNFLSTSFDTNTNSFEEANTYQRSRVIFPKISLDSIKIDLPLSSLENEYEHVNENENKGRMINLWKDMVMKEVRKEQKKENQSKSTSIDERYGDDDQVLAPLPLQFLLECRVDGDKTLDIPLYTEVETIQKSISCDGDKDGDVSSSYKHEYKHEYEQYLEESRNIMQQVLYSYDDQCSGAFLSLALALRYKCPIVITSRALDAIERVQSTVEEIQTEGNLGTMSVCIQQIIKSGECDDDDDEDDVGHVDDGMNEEDKAIQSILPQWRSTNALQSQSKRVVENIEQGFQLTKLQGALKIALQRGDDLAAEKIRAEIDKLLGRNE